MAKRISLFNHKGGVSKTTTTFQLGWMLATKGKTVLLVDADPQCNLTGIILGFKGQAELEDFYDSEPGNNIQEGLSPAFESRPISIEAIDCTEVSGQKNLYLLPGHIRLSEYEVTLGISQELSGSIPTLKNLPGSISFLIEKTAERLKVDYILIDLNPSLSSINQNFLMTSDYFMVPTTPDYFSVMAINSLTSVLPKWHNWSQSASSMQLLKEASYPFPQVTPGFLGTIIQNYRPRGGKPAAGFQRWIDEINETVVQNLFPALESTSMTLPAAAYRAQNIHETYCIETIPDFNSLITISQENQTPVFALTSEQIRREGIVLEQIQKMQTQFQERFQSLADKVIGLTTYEDSN